MSVEIDTDRAALAGSETINDHPGGESPIEGALNDPGDAGPVKRGRKTKPKPGVLVLTCAHCRHPIAGSGAGYAYVSLVDTQRVAQRAAAGYHDPAKARWTLAHRGCAPEALAPMSPHFRLWTDHIGTTDDLLDAMVTLSRAPWFAWSDWGSLARDILADTETANTRAEPITGRTGRTDRTARRTGNLPAPAPGESLAADDPRHGTATGYGYGCRCDRCRAANTEKNRVLRAERKDGLAPDDHRHGTPRGYDWWGCRCDACKAAKSERHRVDYAQRKES